MALDAQGLEESVSATGIVEPAAPAAGVVKPAVPEGEKFESSVQPSGEEKPSEEVVAEPVFGAPVAAYVLEIDGDIPFSEHTPERMEWVKGFETAGAAVGLPAGLAQQMLDAATDLAIAVPSRYPDPQYTDYDDAERDLTEAFGADIAANIATLAQRYTKSLGPTFQAWLEDSGAGNDVSVITALAFAGQGMFKLSPAAAQAQIEKYMRDKASGYNSTDPKRRRLAVAEIGILSRIAHRDATEVASNKLPTPPAEPRVQTGIGKDATVKSEIARLLGDRSSPLNQATHPLHAQELSRYHALLAKL